MSDPSKLRSHYQSFVREGRILLTGHSHQAWPDCARDAQLRYFDESARWIDEKWSASVFPTIDSVAPRILDRLGFDKTDPIAFASNTHELLVRLLSCFPWNSSLRIVTSTGEFHSLYRQLKRLEEDGVRVDWVQAEPRQGLSERIMQALEQADVKILALSAVMFEDSFVVENLDAIIAKAAERGIIPLIDAYHAFNVIRPQWGSAAHQAFVLGGGYKYAQFGEGICFMRFPKDCKLRPRVTGWFADFSSLSETRNSRPVNYGTGSALFAGATFDPSAFYRAQAVLDFFDQEGLNIETLQAISKKQCSFLITCLEREGIFDRDFQLASSPHPDRRGGFVAVRVPNAAALAQFLASKGIWVDTRGNYLRLGPAPYTLDSEIEYAARCIAAYKR